ncbi:flavin reductase family protein [Desulfurococcaceae archaeon MEX13E-LK6-19]|nr:flavin reductase family protein [Desulfurococcaceae archaeon MEX13E-LK6-19]
MAYKEIDPTSYYVFHPRPAYLIVTKKPSGGYNVMAVSWATPVSEEPPLVLIAVSREAYTNQLIRETKEFTINIMGVEHADIVYKAGTVSGKTVDKWEMLGLKPLDPIKITTPGIDGAYGIVECTLEKIVEAGESTLFIGRVEAVRVREDIYTRYGWDLKKAGILLHQSGRAFTIPGRMVFAKKT